MTVKSKYTGEKVVKISGIESVGKSLAVSRKKGGKSGGCGCGKRRSKK
jgi:hypothetical protein